MNRRRRQLQEGEKALWALVVRDVAPLHVAELVPPAAQNTPEPQAIPRAQAKVGKKSQASGLMASSSGAGTGASYSFTAPRAPSAGLRVQQAPRPVETIGKRQPGVDDYSWRRFTQGSFKVERRLDLHGMVAQEAFHRLMEFMDVATHRGLRCVEIITGLGTGHEGGILRRELPHWLERPEIRRRILGLTYPHAGNRGSVRILLRRRR
ncbi:methionine ABC transporter substrate-binding protein [Acetobacter aceti 1023]|nr:methionine ABC transporter substrate-binding protein [Acetobacter aceti 1023]